jgi:hypothetical protein
MKMSFRQFLRSNAAILLLISLCFLPACLGATGPNPAAGPGGGGGDSGFGSAEIDAAGGSGSGGITTDVAQADAGKPHPGGDAAPSNEWQDPHPYNLIGKAEPQCKEPMPPLDAPIFSVRYRLKGTVFELDESASPPFQPVEACAGRVVRVMRGDLQTNLEPVVCKDYVLNAACELDATVSIFVKTQAEEPFLEFLHFALSRQAVEPDSVPCVKEVVSDKEGSVFLPLAGVVNFQEIPQGLPACPQRRSL